MSYPESPDNHPSLEFTHEALQPLYQSLSTIAMQKREGRHLFGQVSPDGNVPVEYQLPIDPGVAQRLFYQDDPDLIAVDAVLAHMPAAKAYPYDESSPLEGFVAIRITSKFSADPSVEQYETIMIEENDGKLSTDVSLECGREAQYACEIDDMLHAREWATEVVEMVLGRATSLDVENGRPFTLEHFEAFHMLSKTLGDS